MSVAGRIRPVEYGKKRAACRASKPEAVRSVSSTDKLVLEPWSHVFNERMGYDRRSDYIRQSDGALFDHYVVMNVKPQGATTIAFGPAWRDLCLAYMRKQRGAPAPRRLRSRDRRPMAH